MAGGHVGEVDVGFHAYPLECLEAIGGQGVVEKLGGRVWVVGQTAARRGWRGERWSDNHVPHPFHESGGHAARLDFFPERRLVFRAQQPVHPRQQGSHGQSHGRLLHERSGDSRPISCTFFSPQKSAAGTIQDGSDSVLVDGVPGWPFGGEG